MKAYIKYNLIVLSTFLISFQINAQTNLVPNPSFDNTCSYGADSTAFPWFIPPPHQSTPDIYNACDPLQNNFSCPDNILGSQMPLKGNGYAGIGMYTPYSTYAYEYMECKLKQPLQAEKKYCAGFYVSLADTSNYAISSIGMFFSKDIITSNIFNMLLFYIPQIKNDTNHVITDKQNWVKISGTFIAKGGEQYITIGNFSDYASTAQHTLKVSNFPDNDVNNPGHTNSSISYYYIDDAFVYACDSTVQEKDTFSLFVPNVFTPNADGKNDLFTVQAKAVSYLNLQIYNRWGSLLNEQKWQAQDSTKTNTTLSWAGRTNAGIACSAGTYFYVLTYTQSKGNSTAYKKGSFTLLR